MWGGAKYDIVVLGLTITSSWGNGHATTYRGLIGQLAKSGYNVLFLERNNPRYAGCRDLEKHACGRTESYTSLRELKRKYGKAVKNAQLVIIGSSVVEGAAVGEWVSQTANGLTAFYDIDTPVTLSKLEDKDYEHLSPNLIPLYDLYLSFTGGPTLDLLESVHGSPMARPLYCSVDTLHYYPEERDGHIYDLGYMGTYTSDRQESLESLMFETARKMPLGRFAVAGAQYPREIRWPSNIKRIDHLAPARHREFYCSQRFTLNLTKEKMADAGYAPSIRLFEAAACGVPIISDYWEGLSNFFIFGEEILLSSCAENTQKYLTEIPEEKRREIGERARKRALMEHSSAHRVKELEGYMQEALKAKLRKKARHFISQYY
ncbi:MAG: glycosyltransferase [Chitinispirillales bacterium]|nr:glycosyltransferase [Chitinispirillales bacterium]